MNIELSFDFNDIFPFSSSKFTTKYFSLKFGGLSTQRHTHLAVGGFRVLAPKPYLHVSMYTAFH